MPRTGSEFHDWRWYFSSLWPPLHPLHLRFTQALYVRRSLLTIFHLGCISFLVLISILVFAFFLAFLTWCQKHVSFFAIWAFQFLPGWFHPEILERSFWFSFPKRRPGPMFLPESSRLHRKRTSWKKRRTRRKNNKRFKRMKPRKTKPRAQRRPKMFPAPTIGGWLFTHRNPSTMLLSSCLAKRKRPDWRRTKTFLLPGVYHTVDKKSTRANTQLAHHDALAFYNDFDDANDVD